jgi:hypothetical protein
MLEGRRVGGEGDLCLGCEKRVSLSKNFYFSFVLVEFQIIYGRHLLLIFIALSQEQFSIIASHSTFHLLFMLA